MSRLRVNSITNESGNGAPELVHGAMVTGIATGTTTNQNIIGDLTVSGNVGIAGTLTFDDSTNVDSIGIVTARQGLKVGPIAGVAGTFSSDGSYTTSGIITAINVSVGNSMTAHSFHGDGSNVRGVSSGILEQISGLCDGSTRTCDFGTYTFPNVTSSLDRYSSNSYQLLDSSSVTYKPPSGCFGVMYQVDFYHSWVRGGHGIQHFRLYINGSADGLSGNTEVAFGRFTQGGTYTENHLSYRWYFRIRNDGGSFDTNTGAMPSWTENKTITLQTRPYSTTSNNIGRFHASYYFDRAASNQFHKPKQTITAYGPTS